MNSAVVAATAAAVLSLAVVLAASTTTTMTMAQPRKNAEGQCESMLDCSLLGDCVDGQCVCDEGWTGGNCQYPDLIIDDSFNGVDNPQVPTWGGMSIFADNKWHFFGESIANQCDIWDYGTNGFYSRSVADTPWGPFEYQQMALPPFHHGAEITRLADGTYVLTGDGKDMPPETVKKDCSVFRQGRGLQEKEEQDEKDDEDDPNASLRRTLRRRRNPRNGAGGLYPFGKSPQDFHFAAFAKDITGPWEQKVIMMTDLSRGVNQWFCNVTNLSPVLLDNGTVIMAFRSKPCVDNLIQACGLGCQSIGIAVSENGFDGPFIRRDDPIRSLQGNEDPFMWKSKRGYHMLLHGKLLCGRDQESIDTCGVMAYSPDSYNWIQSPWPAYDGRVTVKLPNGGTRTEKLELRHRPKITFDQYGVPMVLHTSAKRYSKPYVQNVAVKFNTGAVRDYVKPPPCPTAPKSWITGCPKNVRGIKRNAPGCGDMGKNNCIWCTTGVNAGSCQYGSNVEVCNAPDVAAFYSYC